MSSPGDANFVETPHSSAVAASSTPPDKLTADETMPPELAELAKPNAVIPEKRAATKATKVEA